MGVGMDGCGTVGNGDFGECMEVVVDEWSGASPSFGGDSGLKSGGGRPTIGVLMRRDV